VSNAHFLPEMMREGPRAPGRYRVRRWGVLLTPRIGVRKPHPAIFQKVRWMGWGTSAGNCFFCGR